MEQRQETFLERRVKVNQEIAAGEQIEPGKGRIHDHIVLGEQHHVADPPVDEVAVSVSAEKSGQTLRRDVRGYRGRIESPAGECNGVRIEIRGKDLERRCGRTGQPFQGLREDDGE
jgi:hypothetical protein